MKKLIAALLILCFVSVFSAGVTASDPKDNNTEILKTRFLESVCIYSWFGSQGEMGQNGSFGFPNPDSLHPAEYPEDFEKLIEIDSADYHVVIFEECNTKDKMTSFLKTYFSDETAARLMQSDAFTEHNGYLYEKRGNVALTTVDRNEIKNIDVTFTSDNEACLSVEVDNNTNDSTRVHKTLQYTAKRNSEENWIFDPYVLYLYQMKEADNPRVSQKEVRDVLDVAVMISSFCGPSYPLHELLNLLEDCGIEDIPSRSGQVEKYKTAPYQHGTGYCSFLSEEELYNLFRTVFSDGLAEKYVSQMRSLCGSDGLPLKREIDGLIYEFGTYGDPGGARVEDMKITETGNDEYKIHVRYRYEFDLKNGDNPPMLEDDLILKKIDGKLKFTSFISLNDKAYLSVYPQYKDRYPQEWINPQTSDAPVIAVCVLAISAVAAAVILKKKRY